MHNVFKSLSEFLLQLRMFFFLVFWLLFFSAKGQISSNLKLAINTSFTVVLDPGHGGKDSITRGAGILEKDLVLRIATAIKAYLEERGINVILTRDNDTFISIDDRTDFKGDVFISLHCNSVADSIGPSVREMIKGLEIYTDKSMTSGRLVEKSRKLSKNFLLGLSNLGGLPIRAAKQKQLAVLRENKCPAVLIELGYLSNKEDVKFLTGTAGINELKKSFYNSIQNYRGMGIKD